MYLVASIVAVQAYSQRHKQQKQHLLCVTKVQGNDNLLEDGWFQNAPRASVPVPTDALRELGIAQNLVQLERKRWFLATLPRKGFGPVVLIRVLGRQRYSRSRLYRGGRKIVRRRRRNRLLLHGCRQRVARRCSSHECHQLIRCGGKICPLRRSLSRAQ